MSAPDSGSLQQAAVVPGGGGLRGNQQGRGSQWGGDFPSEADPWTVRIQALNSLAECVQLSKEQMALN